MDDENLIIWESATGVILKEIKGITEDVI